MIVMHIESGLGNQMLSYCEYLAMKKMNPHKNIFIENIIYDIPEANEVICQWNGYELERIFGIKTPNIKSLFSNEQWNEIIKEIRQSEFWRKNWNYPVAFTKIWAKHGLELQNIRGDFESPGWQLMVLPDKKSIITKFKCRMGEFLPYLYLRMYLRKWRVPIIPDLSDKLFIHCDNNVFSGQKLTFKLKNSGIEKIEDEVRNVFAFPPITDKQNCEAMEYIRTHNSIAIHARRGDMLGYNYEYYVTGYFKRAVRYIRKQTSNPVFFIFCDPDSVQWARDNADILGLNIHKDEIHFVDWNKSIDSYRDMQLMAACKHQIITNSSFGWWGAWLNTNPNKITCSPDPWINTTHHF